MKGKQGFQKGEPNWNKGKKRTWPSSSEFKKGKDHPNFGKTSGNAGKRCVATPERIEKIRQKALERWSNPEYKAKFSGEKSHKWKGGVALLRDIISQHFKYRQWRNDIFTRDNYICTWCGQKGGDLCVDHIEPFSYIINTNNIKTLDKALECEQLWNTNNGRVLCKSCHQKTDTFLGKAQKYGK